LASSTISFDQLAEQCQGEGLNPANAIRIAAELARSFGVHDDEVAIFQLESNQLKFIYPAKLANVGMIPLSHSSSVAARTANTRRAEIINNFAQQRHASVFEAVPIDSKTRGEHKPERSAMVIQKMMSVPVVGSTEVLGVIQLSRKGASQKSSGADFYPADLQKLVSAAAMLAKCFK